jgi:hypothetical protein
MFEKRASVRKRKRERDIAIGKEQRPWRMKLMY